MRREKTPKMRGWLLNLIVVEAFLARVVLGARDLYGDLGLDRGVSAIEVKRAYRSLSLIYHPDKQRTSDDEEKHIANERFMEIQNAYSTLSDPERKRAYDLQMYVEEQSNLNAELNAGHRTRGTWDSESVAEGLRQRSGFQQAELISSETISLSNKNIEKLVFNSKKAWLIKIYDDTMDACHRTWPAWEKASQTLDGVTNFGRIHVFMSPRLVQMLGSSGLFARPIRRSDLPVIVGLRPSCSHYSCVKRYRGPIRVDLLSSFVSEKLLMLSMLPTIAKEDVRIPAIGGKQFVLVSPSMSTAVIRTRYFSEEYGARVDVKHSHYNQSDKEFWATKFGVNKLPAMLVLEMSTNIVVEDVSSEEKIRAVFERNAPRVNTESSATFKVLFKALYVDTTDFMENLWFFLTQTDVLPLIGTICAIIAATWFRRVIVRVHKMRYKSTKRAIREDVKSDLVDVHGASLKNKSVYTVVLLTSEPNDRFREVAKTYKSEKLLAFVEMSKETANNCSFHEIFPGSTRKSDVIVWHPSREKYQNIGDIDDRVQIDRQLHAILDGLAEWIACANVVHSA